MPIDPLKSASDKAGPNAISKKLDNLQHSLLEATWNTSAVRAKFGYPAQVLDSHSAESARIPSANPKLPISESNPPDAAATTQVPNSITIIQPNAVLDQLPTDVKADYKIRVLQYARAAIFILDYQTPSLTDLDLKAIRARAIYDKAITALSELDRIRLDDSNKSNPKARKKYINQLADNAANAIHIIATELEPDYKAAEQQLLLAEQILTWHDARVSQTNVSYCFDDYEIKREEIPVTRLTPDQKREYLGRSTKAWYQALPSILKQYIDTHVPESLDGDWATLERTIPATLRFMPGLANFTCNKITIKNLKTNEIISESFMYRSATATPTNLAYGLKANDEDETERVRLASQNIEQYLDARLAFGDLPVVDGKKVIAINSLLNDLFGETLLNTKDNNTRMLADLKKAINKINDLINKYQHNPNNPAYLKYAKYSNLKIILTTTPTNNGRYLWLTRNTHNRRDDQQYMDYCTARIEQCTLDLKKIGHKPLALELSPIYESKESEETIAESEAERARQETEKIKLSKEIALLTAARKSLSELKESVDYFGDRNLLRGALYEIIIPGGLSGCKSGKDREIYKQDYAAALRIYYAQNGCFPNFKLPNRLISNSITWLGYLGAIAAVVAGTASLIIPGILPMIALIGLAAAGGGLMLGAASYHLFKRPDRKVRSNFLTIIRQLRLSGFGALSASLNAHGVYGQKDEDISSSDLTNPRHAQFPLRNLAQIKMKTVDVVFFLIPTALTLCAAGLFIYFTHLLLPHAIIILPVLTVISGPALPIFLTAILLTPPTIGFVGRLLNYYTSPKDDNIKAIKAFELAHRDERKLAAGNKLKGKAPLIRPDITAANPDVRISVSSSWDGREEGEFIKVIPATPVASSSENQEGLTAQLGIKA